MQSFPPESAGPMNTNPLGIMTAAINRLNRAIQKSEPRADKLCAHFTVPERRGVWLQALAHTRLRRRMKDECSMPSWFLKIVVVRPFRPPSGRHP